MILYHGTNVDFEEIQLSKCRPNKDFGQGFYLTDIFSQAQDMAERRFAFESIGAPIVLQYEFDESSLSCEELHVRRFEWVSNEWAEFILQNRMSKGRRLHDYDIVIGPVADDGVVLQLNLYMQRLITMDMLVRELTYHKLNNQYYFGTERAIKYLRRL